MYRFAQLLYLMLPVYAANMAPPFARFWPWPTCPINERQLGSHKTWIGVAFAVVAASSVCSAQTWLAWSGDLIGRAAPWWLLGPVCGLAAMAGDSAKSFFKRRLGIAPGQHWMPYDQIDFVVAALLALSFWVSFTWLDLAFVLGLSFAGSLLVNRASYRMGVKATPW